MRRIDVRTATGLVLLALGLLALLENLGFIPSGMAVFGALLFAVGGVAFTVMYLTRADQWWAGLPAATLLGISAILTLQWLAPNLEREVDGAVFLGALAAGFLLLYVRRLSNWWALIPAGILLTLAVISWPETIRSGLEAGGVLFVGIALTFFAVYLAPSGGPRQRWALIPALANAAVGLVIAAQETSLWGYLWPLAVIGLGLFVLLRSVRLKAR